MARMGDRSPNLESTAELLALVRQGDRAARERLASRYLPVLKRLAHGRLPTRARDLLDTDDLVQVTVLRALDHVETIEVRHEGGFLAYMRQILLNQIRDEIRRVARKPAHAEIDDRVPALGPSPLEEAMGRETVARYEAALGHLSERQRQAVVLRLEMGLSYQQIAEALGEDSQNAVRMMVSRALVRMVEFMGGRTGPDGR